VERIAAGTGFIDLHHCGRPDVIAAAVVELDAGLAVVDPAPVVTLDTLRAGLRDAGYEPADLTHVLLTHIHLDHAGSTGHLVRDNPELRVVVHERGARHLVDPSRLVASAQRLFGDRMEALWGTALPVPASNLEIHTGGESDRVDGGRIEVIYTPGHASHHVAYVDSRTGVAFVGDAAGGRIRNSPAVLPATPPPDLDIDLLTDSFGRIADREPEQMLVTHFGPATGIREHGEQLIEALHRWADLVRRSLEHPGTDAERAAAFGAEVGRDLRNSLGEAVSAATAAGVPPDLSWYGLARYWRKREEAEATGAAR